MSQSEQSNEPQFFCFMADTEGFDNLAHDDRMMLLAICVANQQKAGFGLTIDLRQSYCTCGAPGFNCGWGYSVYTCGSEIGHGEDADFHVDCPHSALAAIGGAS